MGEGPPTLSRVLITPLQSSSIEPWQPSILCWWATGPCITLTFTLTLTLIRPWCPSTEAAFGIRAGGGPGGRLPPQSCRSTRLAPACHACRWSPGTGRRRT